MTKYKNKIKKIIVKKIEFNNTIPAEGVNMLLKESYKVFLGDLSVLTNTIFGNSNYTIENDCIVFETDRPYYYEIQSNGHLIDISREVWQEMNDRIDTVNEALRS